MSYPFINLWIYLLLPLIPIETRSNLDAIAGWYRQRFHGFLEETFVQSLTI
jgi:hypothetical protein